MKTFLVFLFWLFGMQPADVPAHSFTNPIVDESATMSVYNPNGDRRRYNGPIIIVVEDTHFKPAGRSQ